jgi:hypothetical protein
LYENGYFGFLESSEKYMEELVNDIITTLPNRQKRIAPPHFKKYGEKFFFSVFKKNRTTQWYAFFNLYEEKGGVSI